MSLHRGALETLGRHNLSPSALETFDVYDKAALDIGKSVGADTKSYFDQMHEMMTKSGHSLVDYESGDKDMTGHSLGGRAPEDVTTERARQGTRASYQHPETGDVRTVRDDFGRDDFAVIHHDKEGWEGVVARKAQAAEDKTLHPTLRPDRGRQSLSKLTESQDQETKMKIKAARIFAKEKDPDGKGIASQDYRNRKTSYDEDMAERRSKYTPEIERKYQDEIEAVSRETARAKAAGDTKNYEAGKAKVQEIIKEHQTKYNVDSIPARESVDWSKLTEEERDVAYRQAIEDTDLSSHLESAGNEPLMSRHLNSRLDAVHDTSGALSGLSPAEWKRTSERVVPPPADAARSTEVPAAPPSAVESAVESATNNAPATQPTASQPAATSQPAAAPEKTLNRAQRKALEARERKAAAAAQPAAPPPSAVQSAMESASENAPEARPQVAAAALEPAAAPQEAKLAQGAEKVAQAASTGAPIPQPVSVEEWLDAHQKSVDDPSPENYARMQRPEYLQTHANEGATINETLSQRAGLGKYAQTGEQASSGGVPDNEMGYVDEDGALQSGSRPAPPNQNYYERLGYTDVGQNPEFLEDMPNARKYAAALDRADPDQVAETVSNIRGKYAQAAGAAGVEHWSDASESWALWDVGKQLHLHEEAQATGGASANPNYRTANPLTDAQLQDEIVARHLGFSSNPGERAPSHELTRKGRALMDQHGIPHDMHSGPVLRDAPKAGATASKGAKITTGAEAARTGANGMRTGSDSIASKMAGGRGRRFNMDIVDRQLDLTTRGLAGSLSSVINDYGLNRRQAVGGGYMDTLGGKAIRTGGKRVAWSSAEYAAPVFNAAEKEAKWATFATAEEAAESWADEIEGRAGQGGPVNKLRHMFYKAAGGRGSGVNKMMAKVGGFGTVLPVATNVVGIGMGMREGYREGGVGGAMVGGAKGVVSSAVAGQVIGASLAHPLLMLGGASLMMASYKVGHGIFDVRTRGNNYLKMGRAGGLSWNTGSTPGMDSQIASTMRGRALMSMENSRFNAMKSLGNESYMMTSPSARYGNSTQIGSQQPMLAY